jgi:hypothetical protein
MMTPEMLDRLALTQPKMESEPQAYKRAVLRMGYEAANADALRAALARLIDCHDQEDGNVIRWATNGCPQCTGGWDGKPAPLCALHQAQAALGEA